MTETKTNEEFLVQKSNLHRKFVCSGTKKSDDSR